MVKESDLPAQFRREEPVAQIHETIQVPLALTLWDPVPGVPRVIVQPVYAIVAGSLPSSSIDSTRLRLAGRGLACLPESQPEPYFASGQLVRVLEEGCELFCGYPLLSSAPTDHASLCPAG